MADDEIVNFLDVSLHCICNLPPQWSGEDYLIFPVTKEKTSKPKPDAKGAKGQTDDSSMAGQHIFRYTVDLHIPDGESRESVAAAISPLEGPDRSPPTWVFSDGRLTTWSSELATGVSAPSAETLGSALPAAGDAVIAWAQDADGRPTWRHRLGLTSSQVDQLHEAATSGASVELIFRRHLLPTCPPEWADSNAARYTAGIAVSLLPFLEPGAARDSTIVPLVPPADTAEARDARRRPVIRKRGDIPPCLQPETSAATHPMVEAGTCAIISIYLARPLVPLPAERPRPAARSRDFVPPRAVRPVPPPTPVDALRALLASIVREILDGFAASSPHLGAADAAHRTAHGEALAAARRHEAAVASATGALPDADLLAASTAATAGTNATAAIAVRASHTRPPMEAVRAYVEGVIASGRRAVWRERLIALTTRVAQQRGTLRATADAGDGRGASFAEAVATIHAVLQTELRRVLVEFYGSGVDMGVLAAPQAPRVAWTALASDAEALDDPAAVGFLHHAVLEAPHDADLWAAYGAMATRFGRTSVAEPALREALALDPLHCGALVTYGLMLAVRRRFPAAEVYLQCAVDAAIGSPVPWGALGIFCEVAASEETVLERQHARRTEGAYALAQTLRAMVVEAASGRVDHSGDMAAGWAARRMFDDTVATRASQQPAAAAAVSPVGAGGGGGTTESGTWAAGGGGGGGGGAAGGRPSGGFGNGDGGRGVSLDSAAGAVAAVSGVSAGAGAGAGGGGSAGGADALGGGVALPDFSTVYLRLARLCLDLRLDSLASHCIDAAALRRTEERAQAPPIAPYTSPPAAPTTPTLAVGVAVTAGAVSTGTGAGAGVGSGASGGGAGGAGAAGVGGGAGRGGGVGAGGARGVDGSAAGIGAAGISVGTLSAAFSGAGGLAAGKAAGGAAGTTSPHGPTPPSHPSGSPVGGDTPASMTARTDGGATWSVGGVGSPAAVGSSGAHGLAGGPDVAGAVSGAGGAGAGAGGAGGARERTDTLQSQGLGSTVAVGSADWPTERRLAMLRAEQAWRAGNPDRAVDLAQEIASLEPSYAPGRLLLATLLVEAGNIAAALPHFEGALSGGTSTALAPASAWAGYLRLGRTLLAAGALSDARDAFYLAVKAHPCPYAWTAVGDAFIRMALRASELDADTQSSSSLSVSGGGGGGGAVGGHHAGTVGSGSAAGVRSGSGSSRGGTALAGAALGSDARAADLRTRVDPAQKHVIASYWAAAEDALAEANLLSPTDSLTWALLAVVGFYTQRPSVARHAVSTAVLHGLADADVLRRVADAAYAAGAYDVSVATLRRALRSSDSVAVRVALADALLALRMFAEARTQLQWTRSLFGPPRAANSTEHTASDQASV